MAEEPTLVRKKIKRAKYPPHWVIIPSLFLIAAGWGWYRFGPTRNQGPFVLPGYLTSTQIFDQECQRFYEKAAQSVDAEEKFQLAAQAMSNRDFSGAAALLEQASKLAALPVVFNDLGVLYAQMDDPARTVNAFREALARDEQYAPARRNLERLKGMHLSNTAYPVTRELEPNDSLPMANLISLGKPVVGEIGAFANDVDWYRVSAPPPPRDLMRVEVTNQSPTLSLILSICDENMVALAPSQKSLQPGASVDATLSPPANSAVYIRVESFGGSTGPYLVEARVLKAFDPYEPNDQIFSAFRISLSQPIQANIMDAQDADFYSFISPRTGTVNIDIQNRSTTLIPAITTYTQDLRNSGFGPDIDKPGLGLHHTMDVEEGKIYYIQVWSQSDTTGNYTLTIQ